MPDGAIHLPTFEIVARHGGALVGIAVASLRHALAHGAAAAVALETQPAPLRAPGASFVTLRHGAALRGCIGSVAAHRPLAADVAHNARAAAFDDPRFPPLAAGELDGLAVEVSVLSAPEPFPVADEADLLSRIRPGRDGVILQDGARRGLFLPAVWDTLPDAKDFLAHLKQKAGLPRGPLSPGVRVFRFEAFKACGAAA